MARVFGPAGLDRRGGTIAFHLLAPNGEPYDVGAIEDRANAARISLRSGCFCNPGDGEVAHGIPKDAMAQCFAGAATPVSFLDCAQTIRASIGRSPNTLRASLGIASNFADVHAFMAFAESLRDLPADIA
jgi:selenocysteine lyase/cysteine desulfurase